MLKKKTIAISLVGLLIITLAIAHKTSKIIPLKESQRSVNKQHTDQKARIPYKNKITIVKTGEQIESINDLYTNAASYIGEKIEIQTIFKPKNRKITNGHFSSFNLSCTLVNCPGECCNSCSGGRPSFSVQTDRFSRYLSVVGKDYLQELHNNHGFVSGAGTFEGKKIEYGGNECSITGYPFYTNTEYLITVTLEEDISNDESYYYLVLEDFKTLEEQNQN